MSNLLMLDEYIYQWFLSFTSLNVLFISALQATLGDVNAAIEQLLQQRWCVIVKKII